MVFNENSPYKVKSYVVIECTKNSNLQCVSNCTALSFLFSPVNYIKPSCIIQIETRRKAYSTQYNTIIYL